MRAKERLDELGFRETKDFRVEPGTMEVSPEEGPAATRDLVLEGWRVEAEGILYRTAGEFKLAVSTGIDWFELSGQVDFGGQKLALPDILAAARRGETMIALGDGSMGMLPEDWLKKYGLLADLGSAAEGETTPLRQGQAGLLDALLAAQPGSKCDAAFTKVRKQLHAFEGVEPLDAPAGFQGELRPISARVWAGSTTSASSISAASWPTTWAWAKPFRCWRSCSAARSSVKPRAVTDRGAAIARFQLAPRGRRDSRPNSACSTTPAQIATLCARTFPNYDLVVTTYGTLRSDVVELSEVHWDYAILDEAQAIKNSESQAAKAARSGQGQASPGDERHADRKSFR